MTDALHPEVLTPEAESLLRAIGPACESLGFYLAGGTAVALRLGHRRSVDLDWFSGSVEFSPDLVREAFEGAGVALGIGDLAPGTLHGTANGVAVSFLRYRYDLLAEPEPLRGFGCRTASLEDLVCMKLAAATGRGAKKDLIDVAALCRREVSLDRALDLFREKFRLENAGHVVLSLSWFDDAERDPDPPLLGPPSWEEAKAFLVREVRRLASP